MCNSAEEKKTQLLRCLFYTFLLGLAAHGMQFLMVTPSHDYLFSFFEREGEYGNAMELGRYLQPVYRALTGTGAAAPWAIGLQSLLWLSLAVCGTAVMFDFHSRMQIILLAGVMVTNQTVFATAGTYLTYLGPFTFALMLAVFAALGWKKFIETGRTSHFIAAALLVAASAGLYQCYLFVTVTWILLDSIRGMFRGKDWKKTVLAGLMGIAIILVGVGIYFALLYPVCAATGIALKQDDYNSVSNLWSNGTPLLGRILGCYKTFILSFTVGLASVYPTVVMLAVHLVLGILSLVFIFRLWKKRTMGPMETVLALVLAVLLPVATLGISILNGELHDLMKFALCGIYLIPLMLLEDGKGMQKAAALMLGIVIFSNVQTANLLYTEKQLEYDATLSLMTDVASRIEQQEGYEPGVTPVAFIGYPQDGMVPLPYKEDLRKITGAHASSPITHPTKYDYYFRNILEKPLNRVSEEETQIPGMEEMPQYPRKGSVRMLEGVVVVKFCK